MYDNNHHTSACSGNITWLIGKEEYNLLFSTLEKGLASPSDHSSLKVMFDLKKHYFWENQSVGLNAHISMI